MLDSSRSLSEAAQSEHVSFMPWYWITCGNIFFNIRKWTSKLTVFFWAHRLAVCVCVFDHAFIIGHSNIYRISPNLSAVFGANWTRNKRSVHCLLRLLWPMEQTITFDDDHQVTTMVMGVRTRTHACIYAHPSTHIHQNQWSVAFVLCFSVFFLCLVIIFWFGLVCFVSVLVAYKKKYLHACAPINIHIIIPNIYWNAIGIVLI